MTVSQPRCKAILAAALCAAACSQAGLGQAVSASILQIDVENLVQFVDDVGNPSKFATDPNSTIASDPRNFAQVVYIGDIVAVNGQSAKGTFSRVSTQLALTPSPSAGQAIADTTRGRVVADYYEILKNDGSPVGTIVSSGLGEGAAPLGAPLAVTSGTFAIVGGTGAFFGLRGQSGQAMPMTAPRIPSRHASITEDPANRRQNGGGKVSFVLQVAPMTVPQIVTDAAGPAVFHANFSQVTAAKPAKAGEVLIVKASGLGPTIPGLDPGLPFPAEPLQQVNSPIGLTVNGRAAEVVNSVGWPGLLNTYRVDFRVPDGVTGGAAAIQLTAAWIAGLPMNIAIE